MAKEAGDWLARDRMLEELRLPNPGAAVEKMVQGQIAEAVAFLDEHTGLPLLDRSTFTTAPARIPILISDDRDEHPVGIPYLMQVDRVDAQTRSDGPFDTALVIGASPVLEAATAARAPLYRYWPDAALPSGARALRVTMTVGMDPDAPEHQNIVSALILMVRDLFDGLSLAERRPAWERMIESKVMGSGGAS